MTEKAGVVCFSHLPFSVHFPDMLECWATVAVASLFQVGVYHLREGEVRGMWLHPGVPSVPQIFAGS